MSDDVFGLTGEQHTAVGRLISGQTYQRGNAGLLESSPTMPAVVRVLNHDAAAPVYSPKNPRAVAMFELRPELWTKTLELSGDSLVGDILITLNGVAFRIACDATTDQLRAVLPLPAELCRATVFPGLWEFAFAEGVDWGDTGPTLEASAAWPPNPAGLFEGGLLVTDEGWRSVSNDGLTFETVEALDGSPFLEGEVRPGSIALAHWSDTNGYIAGSWSCRDFTFAS